MNKLEMFSEKLGKTITIIAESVEGQKTFKPAMEGTSTVSYTHLDVYKRQVHGPIKRIRNMSIVDTISAQ